MKGDTEHEPTARDGGADGQPRAASPRTVPEPRTRGLLSAPSSFIFILGMPAFGLALASTVVAAYLPVFIAERSGPLVTGLLMGGEGLVGLFLPALVGSASDAVGTRIGARMPFVLAAAALAVPALVLMPLFGSLLGIALSLLLFYVAYFTYYTPYRALYPDLVPERLRGRAVGIQGAWRSGGLLLAMAGGGILIALWRPLPFLLAAATLSVITLGLLSSVRRESRRQRVTPAAAPWQTAAGWGVLRRRPDIRALIAANCLWEFTVAALRSFAVLFLTVGLGSSLGFASVALGVMGVTAVFAAPISGWAADRFGSRRVLEAALWVFGIGLLAPFVTVSAWIFPLIAVVAFAAVVILTLPYSLLMRMMPGEHHGAVAGLFDFSHAVGTLLGPLVAGVAIELMQPVFPSTRGYVTLFGVASLAILASIPLLRRAEANR